MQRIYGWRVNERRKVRKGWQQVSPFVQGQQLGEGLSDRQVWHLEKELPQCSDRFLLPLQLRELYLIANGQCCEQQTGIMNGHRWMPLQEIVELWKERNWSNVEQEAVPKRAAEGAGCREGRQGCVYDRFAVPSRHTSISLPHSQRKDFKGARRCLFRVATPHFFAPSSLVRKSTRALMIARGVSLDSSAPPLWTKPEVNERRHSVS